MTASSIRKIMVFAVKPLLHLIPTPRALSTILQDSLRVPIAAGLRPSTPMASPLPCPPLPYLQPSLGFKTKGVIKKRCKDCYKVKRRGRWFIYCKTNPRHKQRQM
uniref:Ribosomal protein n=2 Tax=Molossus molossus TaxID=27622 RepID=A0A7J8J1K3_MOLMO|nr:mitochondrial ribosomal protein L36 [Molossus molossus]